LCVEVAFVISKSVALFRMLIRGHSPQTRMVVGAGGCP
jgi:hypothetical protein